MVDQVQLLYLNAFETLDKSRQGKVISIVEIEAYTRMFHVDDIELFVRVVLTLDSTLRRLRDSGNKDKHPD